MVLTNDHGNEHLDWIIDLTTSLEAAYKHIPRSEYHAEMVKKDLDEAWERFNSWTDSQKLDIFIWLLGRWTLE